MNENVPKAGRYLVILHHFNNEKTKKKKNHKSFPYILNRHKYILFQKIFILQPAREENK